MNATARRASAAALVLISFGFTAGCSEDSPKGLDYFDVCDGSVLSEDVKPLERLFPSGATITSEWTDTSEAGSLKFTCENSADDASAVMSAEIKDGSVEDWRAALRAMEGVPDDSDSVPFKAGDEAKVWKNEAAVFMACKSASEGSSHTKGIARPYLSVLVRTTGKASVQDLSHRQDLAYLAERMLYNAQVATGCREGFARPSGSPKVEG
ncbi:hypothetical protein ACIHCQ_25690 [Streptomyces sp. NPDC052236]|uniref:hypothetical protein n=1 Tax=Streptomyces sp. NPDC052236 TaxID=3365686 RepID=UPI0037D49D58